MRPPLPSLLHRALHFALRSSDLLLYNRWEAFLHRRPIPYLDFPFSNTNRNLTPFGTVGGSLAISSPCFCACRTSKYRTPNLHTHARTRAHTLAHTQTHTRLCLLACCNIPSWLTFRAIALAPMPGRLPFSTSREKMLSARFTSWRFASPVFSDPINNLALSNFNDGGPLYASCWVIRPTHPFADDHWCPLPAGLSGFPRTSEILIHGDQGRQQAHRAEPNTP